MTTLDEALRALDKEWRERSHRFHGMGGQYVAELFADELAALLTTRQEVAPVAYRFRLNDAHPWSFAYEEGMAGIIEQIKNQGWQADYLYTTTGQTSDARDVPSRETLAGLLAAIYYAQWSTHEDKTRIERCVESALRNFDIGLNRFVPADEQQPAK